MYDEASIILEFEVACAKVARRNAAAIDKHNGQLQAIKRKANPYREHRENTEASLYPSKTFNWLADKTRLPELLAKGPYPTSDEGKWWEQVFKLLIPHVTQIATKQYWYAWENANQQGYTGLP
jgi:hypothetical protein